MSPTGRCVGLIINNSGTPARNGTPVMHVIDNRVRGRARRAATRPEARRSAHIGGAKPLRLEREQPNGVDAKNEQVAKEQASTNAADTASRNARLRSRNATQVASAHSIKPMPNTKFIVPTRNMSL